MGISYKKYRILLAERGLKPADIERNTSVSWTALVRMNKDQPVNLSTLEEICKFLKCDIGDLVEIKED